MQRTLIGFIFLLGLKVSAQTVVNVFPEDLTVPVNMNFKPGVFYVPKTETGRVDFVENDIDQNAIRTHVIESALNTTTNLLDCLSLLETVESDLVNLSEKSEKIIFIFEKMPVWMSSSADGSSAETPGWYVLNTKKPADWDEWQNAVNAITNLIVNDFGIENAYFEVWNEPDLGSWTESKADYLELYKYTYDGVKSAGEEIRVGGPAVNFWANNIYWKPIPGHIPFDVADSSLIADVLNYAVDQNRIPDFVSWHNFNLTYQEFANGASFVEEKCVALGIPVMELILSEWNAPSVIRDTPLAKSFMVKAQLEMSQTEIRNNMIAAWQDFSFDSDEFHNDYGLITYGAIHKPSYNAVQLTNMLKGVGCEVTCIDPNVIYASVYTDTLCLIVSNYCPPAIQEAINVTLFEGEFNAIDLDEAGFIDLETGDLSYLESIYQGETVISDDNPINIAVNNGIETYRFYDSVAVNPRTFEINVAGHTGDYASRSVLINDQRNNMQFRYDSLRLEGFSQESATTYILSNQNLNEQEIPFIGGANSITLDPNAVVLFKIGIDGISGLEDLQQNSNWTLLPNPAMNQLTILLETEQLNTYTI